MPDHRIVLTYDPDGTLADRVRAALPDRSLEVVRALTADAVLGAVPGTTIFFGNYLAPAALALMFALARRLPQAVRSQSARRYVPEPHDELFELTGKTLGIVGFGDVGQALARRARGIGMRVIATRRRPRGSPTAHALTPEPRLDPLAGSEGGDPSALADEVLGPDRLDDLLRESDVVANVVPLTPATARLFGREQFARMRPTACFINVGRGETVDQDALNEALRDGVIAAAGLDVTTPEPLPPDSPLWAMPNVILTAHYAGWSDTMLERIYAIFLDNLGRFDRGEPLRNQVDVRTGY